MGQVGKPLAQDEAPIADIFRITRKRYCELPALKSIKLIFGVDVGYKPGDEWSPEIKEQHRLQAESLSQVANISDDPMNVATSLYIQRRVRSVGLSVISV